MNDNEDMDELEVDEKFEQEKLNFFFLVD